ncbi:MAG TPA: 1-deoxy-D-xylulose-5-phosphate reductoisomerase [Candidatus Eisenbacteria bacterium]|nr:1-deoxy-D-xylulose-5-phosphate reductoisomerase [Candidatus Eisenbacteria bacterium]
MRTVSLLGSTGSIGKATLDVVRGQAHTWQVVAIAAGRDVDGLVAQAAELGPALVAIGDVKLLPELGARIAALGGGAARARVVGGAEGVIEAALTGDIVVNALVGAAGLAPTLAAIERGARLALANKESLVVAGEWVTRRARECRAEILPVDSEHSGLFQCLAGGDLDAVERLVLTASGGPLRRHPDWRRARPDEVLAHPVWRMGRRITTDSATLLNKGFEVIEARWLFGVGLERIDVLVHPQAIMHALVEWKDGSQVAQLSLPDMRLPIQVALSWPERLPAPIPRLDLAALGSLEFEPVDPARFPLFRVAREAALAGGLAPAVLNAADEEAVTLFHEEKIGLGELVDTLERVVDACPEGQADSLAAIVEADRWAREEVRRVAVGS